MTGLAFFSKAGFILEQIPGLGHQGNRFFHGFGDFGPRIENRSPHMHWLYLSRIIGAEMPSYEHWSMATMMARKLKFTPASGDTPSHRGYYYPCCIAA